LKNKVLNMIGMIVAGWVLLFLALNIFVIHKAKIVWPIEEYKVIQGYTKWKSSDAAG